MQLTSAQHCFLTAYLRTKAAIPLTSLQCRMCFLGYWNGINLFLLWDAFGSTKEKQHSELNHLPEDLGRKKRHPISGSHSNAGAISHVFRSDSNYVFSTWGDPTSLSCPCDTALTKRHFICLDIGSSEVTPEAHVPAGWDQISSH